MLRPDARKQIVLTGDGDANQSFEQFQQRLAALGPSFAPGSWQMSAVYCREACPGTCPTAATQYPMFVQRTGGVGGSLCAGQPGFSEVIDDLATAVIVGAALACEWTLPPPPDGETFDKNKVNVVYTSASGQSTPYGKLPPNLACDGRDGWYYDNENAPTKILVCPRTCTAIQAESDGRMDIELGCATRFLRPD
jgi:hypothetical protein